MNGKKRKPLPVQRGRVGKTGIYTERRGVLSVDWDLSAEALARAESDAARAVDDCKRMLSSANLLLEHFNIETPQNILIRLEKTQSNEPLSERFAQELTRITIELALRHGVLSPVTIAARFAGSLLTLSLRFAPDSGAVGHAIAFADAYRAFHFERFGGHDAAYQTSQVNRGRADAKTVKERNKALQRKEIEVYYKQHMEAHRSETQTASGVANAILETLNDSLKIRGLPAISQSLLRREIADLMRAG